MKYLGLPLYEVTLVDDEDRMTVVSLVDDPAVESDFIMFSEDKKPQLFNIQDKEQQVILGVAIRADYPIYRIDPSTGFEYFITFSKEVIKDIVKRYSKDGFFNNVSLQHNGKLINGVTMIEMFIKDTERGINPKGFEDIEEGSLFIAYHVENKELWNAIKKSGEFNGFSIEIYATPVPSTYRKEEDEMFTIDMETLTADFSKKKETFSVADELAKIVGDSQCHDLTISGNRTLTGAQVYQIGMQDGKNMAVIYADSPYGGRKQWYIYETKNITNIKPSNSPFVDWNTARQGASWQGVEDLLDDLTVSKTAIVASNDLQSIIENRVWVMIDYNDEEDNPHTGARQCMVLAWGLTKRGNECIRVYEKYGDSRSAAEGFGEIPDYRLMLTKRVLSLRVLDFMEPWTDEDLDWRYNWYGDDSMSEVFFHYEGEDKFI